MPKKIIININKIEELDFDSLTEREKAIYDAGKIYGDDHSPGWLCAVIGLAGMIIVGLLSK